MNMVSIKISNTSENIDNQNSEETKSQEIEGILLSSTELFEQVLCGDKSLYLIPKEIIIEKKTLRPLSPIEIAKSQGIVWSLNKIDELEEMKIKIDKELAVEKKLLGNKMLNLNS